MYNDRLRRKHGFTVLEMVVTTALLTMLGAAFLALIVHSLAGWSSGSSETNASNAASIAIQKLFQDIRVGSSAYVSNGQLYVSVPPLITDSHSEQYYNLDGAATTYRYYLSGTTLYRQIGTATATVFARDISSIAFTASGGLVTVTLTGASQEGASDSARHATCSGQIVMRNFRG